MAATDSYSQKSLSYLPQKAIWICRHCAGKLPAPQRVGPFQNYATCGVCHDKTAVAIRQPKHD